MRMLKLTKLQEMRKNERKDICNRVQGGHAEVVIDAILSLNVWYVDNWNLWLDFRISILTILKVLKCEGIIAEGIFKSMSNIKLLRNG